MSFQWSLRHILWHVIARPYIDKKDGVKYTVERVPEFWPKEKREENGR